MRFPEDAPRIVRVTGGLYSRITALGEGALKVSELDRMSDVGVQARCVYEHTVTMAWLTGDRARATERMILWQSDDDRKRSSLQSGHRALDRDERSRYRNGEDDRGRLGRPG